MYTHGQSDLPLCSTRRYFCVDVPGPSLNRRLKIGFLPWLSNQSLLTIFVGRSVSGSLREGLRFLENFHGGYTLAGGDPFFEGPYSQKILFSGVSTAAWKFMFPGVFPSLENLVSGILNSRMTPVSSHPFPQTPSFGDSLTLLYPHPPTRS